MKTAGIVILLLVTMIATATAQKVIKADTAKCTFWYIDRIDKAKLQRWEDGLVVQGLVENMVEVKDSTTAVATAGKPHRKVYEPKQEKGIIAVLLLNKKPIPQSWRIIDIKPPTN